MARFLLATVPTAGHMLPILPIVRRLVARGHDVAWITGAAFAQRVAQTGAHFFALPPALDYSRTHVYDLYPELKQLEGYRRGRYYLRHIYLGTCSAMLAAVDETLRVFAAQALIGDNAMFALSLKAEMTGLPSAKLSVLPLGVPSRDTAPFGMGLQPGRGAPARLRNRLLNSLFYTLLIGDLNREANQMRQGLGLAPLHNSFLIAAWQMPQLVMQLTAPAFEYPRSDLPPHIHFVGPSPPLAAQGFEQPSWWRDLAGPQPVVLLNQGTVESDAADLILPAAEGLRAEPLLTVAVPLSEERAAALPANGRAAPFIPFDRLLPHVDVMVTNGGYGGTQAALAHGVPLVVAGTTDDKMEVAARVAWTGAGINLRTRRPSPAALREAVNEVLANPTYKQQARRIGHAFALFDAPSRAAELLEGLLAQRPV